MASAVPPALLIATLLPLFFLHLIHTLDLYGAGSRRAIAVSFCWGIISVALALAVYRLIGHDQSENAALATTLTPILEEALKAVILVYLIRRPTFTFFVDGAVYGFAVGIGFAVAENYLYILQEAGVQGEGELAATLALARVLSTNLMHASAGAIVGIALGISRFRASAIRRLFHFRALYLASGLLLAILLHGAFNRLLVDTGRTLESQRVLFFYALGAGVSGAAFTALAIRRGLAIEKRWIAETLGAGNRVTPAEITVTRQLEHIDTLLEPLAVLFGPQKARQMEKMLRLQAQVGILLKRLQQSGRTADQALLQTLAAKEAQMEGTRRHIGTYMMASLRVLFPQSGSRLWDQLEARAAAARADEVGANLFDLAARRQRRHIGKPSGEGKYGLS